MTIDLELLGSYNLIYNPVKDISDLINHTFMFRHTDVSLINKYNELWKETLDELEPKKKQLVMFKIKLLYEQRMKERAHDPVEFEKIRFSAGRDSTKLFSNVFVYLANALDMR